MAMGHGRVRRITWVSVLCLLMGVSTEGIAGEEADGDVVTGRVVDAEGTPVAGARVSAYALMENLRLSHVWMELLARTESSGEDGAFEMPVSVDTDGGAERSPIRGFCVAEKEGFAIGWREGEGEGRVEIRLAEPAVIGGRVVDRRRRPIAGAEVRALVSAERAEDMDRLLGLPGFEGLTARTDERGRFVLDNIPIGARAELLVDAPGKAKICTFPRDADWPYTFQFPAGKRNIRITLPDEGIVAGRVIDDEGKAAGGVELLLVSSHDEVFSRVRTCVSQADGTFQIDSLLPGEHTLQLPVWPAPYAGDEVAVDVREGQTARVEFPVRRGGVIEVVIKDGDTGEGIRDTSVDLVKSDEALPSLHAYSDAEGVARFRVIPGTYRVESAWAIDYDDFGSTSPSGRGEQTSVNEVQVDEGGIQRVEITLAREPATAIKGMVVDSADRPVAGARVSIVTGGSSDSITNGEGGFEVPFSRSNPKGDHVALATAKETGLAGWTLFSFTPGEDVEGVELVATPGVKLECRVKGKGGKGMGMVRVHLRLGTQDWDADYPEWHMKTDADGVCVFEVVPKGVWYRVSADAEGYIENDARIDIPPTFDEDSATVEIVLARDPFLDRVMDRLDEWVDERETEGGESFVSEEGGWVRWAVIVIGGILGVGVIIALRRRLRRRSQIASDQP